MTTRRDVLKSIPLAVATSVPIALSTRSAAAGGHVMSRDAQQAMSPDQALSELKAGNKRFTSGKMQKRDLLAQVSATASGQFPFAVVLGCIDSRVPPELVFDQGIGDIFTPRIAGNFANTDIIGSIEFSTKLAGAKLIVVLGHTECGAVKGACDGARLGNLTSTLSKIAPAIYSVTDVDGDRNSKNATFVQQVADENVRLTVGALTERSSVLGDLVSAGQLRIVGAMHDVRSGTVTFSS